MLPVHASVAVGPDDRVGGGVGGVGDEGGGAGVGGGECGGAPLSLDHCDGAHTGSHGSVPSIVPEKQELFIKDDNKLLLTMQPQHHHHLQQQEQRLHTHLCSSPQSKVSLCCSPP